MIHFFLAFALLTQTVGFHFKPPVVTPGDSYVISVPDLAGRTIDLRYHLESGAEETASSFCQLNASGECTIAVAHGSVQPGSIFVTGVRRHGESAWLETQAEIKVLPDPLPSTIVNTLAGGQSAPIFPRSSDWRYSGSLTRLFGATALALLAILCAGRWLLFRLRDPFPEAGERIVFSWALGCLLIGVTSFAIAALALAYQAVFLGLALGAVALGWKFLPRPAQFRDLAAQFRGPRGWLEWIYVVVAAFFAVIYVLAAIVPETGPDGVAYHLGLLSLYFPRHRLGTYTHTFFAGLPQGMEMVFLFCSALGGYAVARLAHLLCLFTLVGAVSLFARRLGLGRLAPIPGLVLLACPALADSATAAEVDTALALAIFLAFWAAYAWRTSAERSLLLLAGLLAGWAMSIKPTGAVGAALVVLMILWPGESESRLRVRLRAAALVALLAGAVLFPWLARNWMGFQNPVFPVGNRLFRNAHMLPFFERGLTESLRHWGGFGKQARDYLTWPLEVTVFGRRLQGMIGPFFLLAPLGLLAWRRREGKWLLGAALIVALPDIANILVRFLLPALPFLALSIVLGVRPLLRFRAVAVVFALLLAVQGALALPWVISARGLITGVRQIPLAAALHRVSEHDYLSRRLDHFDLVEFLEQHTPPDSRVLTFDAVYYQAYTSRVLLSPWGSEEIRDVIEVLDRGISPSYAPDRRLEVRFAPTEATAARIQKGGDVTHQWQICEVEVFGPDGQPIDPSELIYSASINRWTAGRAGDGKPMSCWSAHEDLGPGAWFMVNLRTPRKITGVRILTSAVGAYSAMHLQLADVWGNPITIHTPFQLAVLPPQDWRAQATALLKSRGVDYIMFPFSAGSAFRRFYDEFLLHPEQWRLREVYRVNDAFVFQLPSS